MVRALALVAAACGVISVFFTPLSMPAALALLILGLLQGSKDKRVLAAVIAGAVASVVGMVRFVALEAAPGVVEAGQNAQARSAMYKLREIRLAEDGLRKTAAWDPDHDGIGSAGSLAELAGVRPLRGQQALAFALLPLRWQKQQQVVVDGATVDVACLEGYCFAVYVPDDDELAERRYVAYAWPADHSVQGKPHAPMTTMKGDPRDVLRGQVLFLDEHERIYESGNEQGYVGTDKVPSAFAAFPSPSWGARPDDSAHGHEGVDGGTWRPWKGKQPLPSLAGDTADGHE
jgi:hypothetical protein